MSDVLWFNGRWTTTDEAVLTVEDRGLQFADALYEVTRFDNRRPSFNVRHYRRLQRAMVELEFPEVWTDEATFDAHVMELLQRTEFDSGIIYLQVTRGVSERNHIDPGTLEPNVMMYSRRFNFPDRAKKESGAGVITLPDLRWGRCDLKTTNLLPAVMAKKQAHRNGCQEAIFIKDGYITEGAATSFYGVIGGTVITHPADAQILPGVVREVVLELAEANGIRVEQRPVQASELAELDEAFLTSTTQGVLPITTIDGNVVASGERGTVTARLQSLFDAAESREFRPA